MKIRIKFKLTVAISATVIHNRQSYRKLVDYLNVIRIIIKLILDLDEDTNDVDSTCNGGIIIALMIIRLLIKGLLELL